MNIQITAKTYTSAAEMIEAGKLRRAKLLNGGANPAPRKAIARLPIEAFYKGISIYPPDQKPVKPRKNLIATTRPAKPEEPKTYDLHVQDFRTLMRFAHNRCRFHIFARSRDFGIPYADIMSGSRVKDIVHTRQIIIWELRVLFSMTHTEIGKLFGLDHTTALHAIRKIQALIDADELENPYASLSGVKKG